MPTTEKATTGHTLPQLKACRLLPVINQRPAHVKGNVHLSCPQSMVLISNRPKGGREGRRSGGGGEGRKGNG